MSAGQLISSDDAAKEKFLSDLDAGIFRAIVVQGREGKRPGVVEAEIRQRYRALSADSLDHVFVPPGPGG